MAQNTQTKISCSITKQHIFTRGLALGKIIKHTTVDVSSLSREDLEQAYKDLLKVSLQKTEMLKFMAVDLKKANDVIKRIGDGR